MSYRDRKQIVKDLRPIYQAATEDDALEALIAFDDKWGSHYPMIGEMWRRHWEQFIPFFAFPAEIRRIVYTTDDIVKRSPRVSAVASVRRRPRMLARPVRRSPSRHLAAA